MADHQHVPTVQTLNNAEIDTLKKLFEDSPVFMCVMEGPEHRVRYMNTKLRDLNAHRPRPIGEPARQVWPELSKQGPDDEDLFDGMDRLYQSGESAIINEHELSFERSSGKPLEQIFFNIACQPIKDENGTVQGLLLTGQDVTERLKAHQAKDRLETDQKKTEEKLKKAIKVRDDFMAIASHELQTPVTSIKTRTELLELQLRSEGNDVYAEEMTKIRKQVDQLGELCNNLLDISRISEGQLELDREEFSMKRLIEETLEMIAPLSEHKLITTYETAGRIYADPYRLEQVLINLLNNAIKYSPEHQDILVRLWENAQRVHISVTDFGIGITEKEKKHIFKRFYRGEDTGKDTYPGMGAGLFISRGIIKRHGGDIQVHANGGAGSVFTVSLPKPGAT